MVNHRPSDAQVHVIPADEPPSETKATTTSGKRNRQCRHPKRHPTTCLQAIHSLHRYGQLTKTITSSLIEQECASLNEKLMNFQQNKRQRRGFDPTTEVAGGPGATTIRGASPASSPDVRFSGEVDVEDLWQRAHRNKRMALLLRDFEILHHMLLSEISSIAKRSGDDQPNV